TGVGELDCVANEIDEDLRQAPSVTAARGQLRSHLDFEHELFVGCQRLQRAANRLGNILNGIIGQFEDKLASLDLGQIKHVIDEPEQMLTVGLQAFEYAKHLVRWLAVSTVRHQFGIAEDSVEGRPQLVAHIGQEL